MTVGETTVQYVPWGEGMLVAVWSDISGRAAGFRTEQHCTASPGRADWSASVKAEDGRAVKFKGITTEGKPQTVTVNGKEYSLEDGALFLVRTRGGRVRVTQVKRDLSDLPPTSATWDQLAKESPQVKAFLAKAGRGK
jgi:hypothetical protein